MRAERAVMAQRRRQTKRLVAHRHEGPDFAGRVVDRLAVDAPQGSGRYGGPSEGPVRRHHI
jgi:hypothetical protein